MLLECIIVDCMAIKGTDIEGTVIEFSIVKVVAAFISITTDHLLKHLVVEFNMKEEDSNCLIV
jgi:hypothetical protein